MKMELIAAGIQVNFSLTLGVLPAEPTSIMKLMLFIEKGFFPSFIDIPSENGVKSKALRIERELNEITLSVTFSGKNIGINFDTLQMQKFNISEIYESIDLVTGLLIRSFPDINIKANRAAVVINEGYKFNQEFEKRLFNMFFKNESQAIEWSFRIANKDQLSGENIFNVTAIQRGLATVDIKGNKSEADALLITIDNNTTPENSDSRFDLNSGIITRELIKKSFDDMKEVKGF